MRSPTLAAISSDSPPARIRVKVCCISSPAEAALAVRAGADAIGLVGAMPSGPGSIADRLIAEIAASVPPPVATFLLTSETGPAAVVAHARRTNTSTLQLVDDVPVETYAAIRAELPGVRIVQVLHVESERSIADAERVSPLVDAILLDSGRPTAAVRELGGTGRIHDWDVSARVVAAAGVPVFVAGGLHPDNVAAAIDRVRPYGVDVCSGLRTNGTLDEAKLSAFFRAIR